MPALESANAPTLPEVSPINFYQRLFGPDFQDPNAADFKPNPRIMARRSVLSGVIDEIKGMEREIGSEDKQRLDQYLTGLRHASSVEFEDDDPEEIAGPGLPVALRFGFPDRANAACPDCRPRPFGIIGAETFDPGYAGDPVRTSWRRLAVPPASP